MTGDHGQKKKICAQAIGTRQRTQKKKLHRGAFQSICAVFAAPRLSPRRLQGEGNAQKKLDKRPVKCFWMSRARRGAAHNKKKMLSTFAFSSFSCLLSSI
jgi:hypothetical protein